MRKEEKNQIKIFEHCQLLKQLESKVFETKKNPFKYLITGTYFGKQRSANFYIH